MRKKNKKRNADSPAVPLGRESILQYVKACTKLHTTQYSLGMSPYEAARGPLVKTFLDTLAKKNARAIRADFDDREKNTSNDGYTKVELCKVRNYFLTQKNCSNGCQDRLCILLNHPMLCRSQTALVLQFAGHFSLTVGNQGISECIALIATIAFGKTKNTPRLNRARRFDTRK